MLAEIASDAVRDRVLVMRTLPHLAALDEDDLRLLAEEARLSHARAGERLFAEGVTISDDPHRRRGLGSRPFDGEGVSGPRLAVIEDGILRHWLLDSASARELGLVSNGRAARGTGLPSPSSTNLTLEPGSVSRADMIGSGVNGVTGDYSRGASGFWIEQGELTYPVAEITVAGNLKDMYRRLTPADDLEYRFGINAPTVRIEGLTIAGR